LWWYRRELDDDQDEGQELERKTEADQREKATKTTKH
jgi:hypothetical protein